MVDQSREAGTLRDTPRPAGHDWRLVRSMVRITAVLLLTGCGITDLVHPTHPTHDDAEPVSIATEHLPSAELGVEYEKQLAADGGDGSYSWSVVDGVLPRGLELTRDGVIYGTPTLAGDATFTLRVESGDAGESDTRDFGLTVVGNPVVVTTESLPSGTTGVPYQTTLEAEGAGGGYSWTIVEGALPTGLSLTAAGVIQGMPAQSGESEFVVRAEATDGQSADRALSLTISAPPGVINTTSFPIAQVGIGYEYGLTARGGDGDFDWSLVDGALPAGLSLSVDGVIDGVPEESGTSAFTVRVESGDGQVVERAFSIEVEEVGLTIYTEANLPVAVEGLPYQLFLDWDGGDAPWSWSIVSGTLPNDLFLASWGAIQGIAEDPGTHVFTLRVESGDGQSAERTFTLVVEPSG